MTKVNEIWKAVVGYEGLYEVSNLGRVRSLDYLNKGITSLLKIHEDKLGYCIVRLYKNGKHKTYRVHRLVAIAFIPNTENKPCIDHINTIRNDNCVENLRWSTVVDNCNNPITKHNHSVASKGRTLSKESRLKISLAKKGKKHSEESKKRMSASSRRLKYWQGKKRSEDTKRKLSKPVCQYSLDKSLVAEYYGTNEASRMTNVQQSKISMCCNGKRKTAGGFIWKYKE